MHYVGYPSLHPKSAKVEIRSVDSSGEANGRGQCRHNAIVMDTGWLRKKRCSYACQRLMLADCICSAQAGGPVAQMTNER